MEDMVASPTTTTTGNTEAAAADVINLAMKPKVEPLQREQQQQQQTQKMRKLVRRNASDKLKLIQMVHDNPILWDSRLPNFKGAEEEKTRAWEQIGHEFNAPGRRVARAFKSLRESYRRELAHVKVMGNGFKPKWSLYESMDFLRDVIRERKGGSHLAEHSAGSAGLNLSALSHHNISLSHNINNNSVTTVMPPHNSLNSSFYDSALNLSSRSTQNMSQDNYANFVKRELDLSNSAAQHAQLIAGVAINGYMGQRSQQQQHHDARVSSTRNDNAHHANNNNNSNSNNNFDDLDGGSSSPRSADEASVRNATLSCSDEVEELDVIDADFPYPLILDNSTSPQGVNGALGGAVAGSKRRRKDLNDGGAEDNDDDDEEHTYDGQMLQQHRHLRLQNGLDMPPPQTVREVLNSKFCGFISAKLNSMEDTEADNLMNKILMLLVQTQGNALLQEANK